MDPRSPHDQLLYPHACFTALRENTHLQYNPNGKFWEVTDYDMVRYIASEHEIFSSDETRVHTLDEEPVTTSILTTDPPRHRQLRSLVSQAFTPKSIAQLAQRIESITHDLLDKVADQGEMDVIQDLSYPLPVIVIAEMLGVPIDDRMQFKQWSDDLVSGEYDDFVGEDRELVRRKLRARFQKTIEEINAYFKLVIAQRRKKPASDLISALLAAQIDGEALSEQELLGFCSLLLIAGNITTTNLIGNAILCFDEHPEVMACLREQPEGIPQAIEEVLRYRSPAVVIGRMPLCDIELAGQQIKRGEFVLGWLACANHDPSQFPHPERFDIERNPNRHVAFGHGIHFCLGAPLARLETKIALTVMLERLLDIQRDRSQDIEPVQSTFIYGAKHLPITFNHR
jgi:cytochrome P450 family 109